MADDVVKIFVDDVAYEVPKGQNLLHACLSHGLDLPYFCWHPSLGSVGACRQCAVIQYADEDDQRGRLTMACMTPVSDGARISIEAPAAATFRSSVVEWLMENHPHDCPVCEEGGECHLQDMTVMTGHTQRRYRGTKRTFENQYLGPFLNHEMNRCITCYRCVRFYRDYAGGDDLQAFGSRSRMYFGRVSDGVLENEFSGNLVEVCPTGVFTDKPFSASYTRKWDLQSAPSVCTGCAVGCNTFAAERGGRLKRIQNRYHSAVNGYFLCDRGRFGADFVNADDRLRQVGERIEDDLFDALDADLGVARVAEMLLDGDVVGIGSPRASLETNVALKKLVGASQFCTGMSTDQEDQLGLILELYRAAGRVASVADIEMADAAVVLGEDVLNTAPRVALALRQTVRNLTLDMASAAGIPQWQDAGVRSHGRDRVNPLFVATVLPTGIDDIATNCFNEVPERLADSGFAIAALIAGETASEALKFEVGEFERSAAEALLAAERPLLISGTGSRSRRVLEAASAILEALEKAGKSPCVLMVAPEANSMGSAMLGGDVALETVLERAAAGSIKTLIVAENDLFRRAAADRVTLALSAVENVVVLDSQDSPTATQADLVFPAATFAESTGTFVNLESRAQRFYAVFEASEEIAASWVWLVDIAAAAGRDDLAWQHVDEVLESARELPGLDRLQSLITNPAKMPANGEGSKIPRAPQRYSGRTAITAQVNIHEPKSTVDEETPLAYSMEGRQPTALLPFSWSPGWNSNQSIFKFQQEVGGPMIGGDSGVRLLVGSSGSYPQPLTAPAAEPEGPGFRLLPAHSIFGSDELSFRSPPVAERTPGPYMVLNPADAARLSLSEASGVRCTELASSFSVRFDQAVRPGYAVVSVGLKGAQGELPDAAVELLADPDHRPAPGPNDRLIARG